MRNISSERPSLGSAVDFERRSVALIGIESSLFLVVNTIAFTGNLFICLALYRNQALRTNTNIFVLSLALTDLLMSVLVMPLKVASLIGNQGYLGDAGCQFTGVTSYCLAGISLLTLTQIALNRYFRVVRPSLYPKFYSKKNSIVMVVFVWVLTILIGIVAFFVLNVEFRHSLLHPAHCIIHYSSKVDILFYTAVIVVYNVPTSLLIAVFYAKVYLKIRKHNAEVQRENSPHGVEESAMTKMFAAVLFGFYLCWIPVFVTNVLNAFNGIAQGARLYRSFYHLLPVYTSSMINPIIYAVMSQRFRAEFLKILRKNLYIVIRQGLTSESQSVETKNSPVIVKFEEVLYAVEGSVVVCEK